MADYAVGSTIDFKFSTSVNGTPTALSGGTVSAYPTNSTTQTTTGVTLTADFDGVTGLNHVRVVATSGNGYSAGDYQLVITAGTVGGVSQAGKVVGAFSLDMAATAIRSAIGLASANLDTQLGDLPTNAELATALAGADDAVLAAIAALNNLSASQVLTTQMTESYAADGTAPTLAQAIFLIQQRLMEFAISSTTITVKKLDGSTTAATLTLDDATSPTSSTRTT